MAQRRYGAEPTALLSVEDRPDPEPGAGEVLLRVEATGVSRAVWHLVLGTPYAVRLAMGLRRPRREVPGQDVAGEVLAVGEGVTRWSPGDAVLGTGRATYAELAVAEADALVAWPPALDVAEAAALPDSGSTAWQALHQHARIQPSERVLVIGASGGVGAYAVGLAVAAGAHVTGVASAAKHDFVRGLGAAEVIDHRTEEIDARGRHDVVIDIAGGRPVRVLRRALAPHGRVVIVGSEDGGPLLGGLARQPWAQLVGMATRQPMRGMFATSSQQSMTALVEGYLAGTLRPVVTRRYPLAEAGQALADLGAGRITGKAVLLP